MPTDSIGINGCVSNRHTSVRSPRSMGLSPSEERLIGFARRSRPAVDYESELNPSPPDLHAYVTLD